MVRLCSYHLLSLLVFKASVNNNYYLALNQISCHLSPCTFPLPKLTALILTRVRNLNGGGGGGGAQFPKEGGQLPKEGAYIS